MQPDLFANQTLIKLREKLVSWKKDRKWSKEINLGLCYFKSLKVIPSWALASQQLPGSEKEGSHSFYSLTGVTETQMLLLTTEATLWGRVSLIW